MTNIYSPTIIQRAIQDYKDICQIRVEENTDHIVCEFVESVADIELTIYEFSNYLIELINAEVSNGLM